MNTYRIAPDVAWVSSDALDLNAQPTAYALTLPGGRPIVLSGTSCLIWLAVAELSRSGGATLTQVVDQAVTLGGITMTPNELAAATADTSRVLEELTEANLLSKM